MTDIVDHGLFWLASELASGEVYRSFALRLMYATGLCEQ